MDDYVGVQVCRLHGHNIELVATLKGCTLGPVNAFVSGKAIALGGLLPINGLIMPYSLYIFFVMWPRNALIIVFPFFSLYLVTLFLSTYHIIVLNINDDGHLAGLLLNPFICMLH